jgi:hypothetical protein
MNSVGRPFRAWRALLSLTLLLLGGGGVSMLDAVFHAGEDAGAHLVHQCVICPVASTPLSAAPEAPRLVMRVAVLVPSPYSPPEMLLHRTIRVSPPARGPPRL